MIIHKKWFFLCIFLFGICSNEETQSSCPNATITCYYYTTNPDNTQKEHFVGNIDDFGCCSQPSKLWRCSPCTPMNTVCNDQFSICNKYGGCVGAGENSTSSDDNPCSTFIKEPTNDEPLPQKNKETASPESNSQ